jgi:dsDNA-specific endonuclease/ATPase MutS2
MKFQINDTVSVLDDTIDGVVIAITTTHITIETTDGFPLNFQENQLVKIGTEDYHFKGLAHAKSLKEDKKKTYNTKKKHTDEFVLVVDLHIEKLVKSKHGMSNYDILSLQLDTAKHKLDFSIQKRFPKVVLVHGVGDGVLKADIYSMLRRYDNIRFYEADYQNYGMGATEIRILQQK